jgi:hypothetical protein
MHLYITPGLDILICVGWLVLQSEWKTLIPRDEYGAQISFYVFALFLAAIMLNDSLLSLGHAIVLTLR